MPVIQQLATHPDVIALLLFGLSSRDNADERRTKAQASLADARGALARTRQQERGARSDLAAFGRPADAFERALLARFPASVKPGLLDGSWRFKALGDNACKIEFRLHYEFSSKLLEKIVGPVFHFIASTFVDAFVKRAQQIYGKR